MNKEYFYCALDQFIKNNGNTEIVNPWLEQNPNCTTELLLENPEEPLINFDRFKGSFLSIKNKTALVAKQIEFFNTENLNFNIYLNVNQINNKEDNNNEYILSTFLIDEEYQLVFYVRSFNSSTVKLYFKLKKYECKSIVFDTEIDIVLSYDLWYNCNFIINKSGNITCSFIDTKSILDPSTGNNENVFEIKLSECLENKQKVTFKKISRVEFGNIDNIGETDASDIYILRDPNEEELNNCIENGINVTSKYNYRTKIGFEIHTLYKDQEYEGLQFFNKKDEKFFLRLHLDNYTIVGRGESSLLTLKIKKGLLDLIDSDLKSTEDIDDKLQFTFNIEDNKTDYFLDNIQVRKNIPNSKMFTQCEISNVTIFENGSPIEIADYLCLDSTVVIFDNSKKSNKIFEAQVVGNKELLISGNSKSMITVNLLNISGEDVFFNHNEAENNKGKLAFDFRYFNLMLKQNGSNGANTKEILMSAKLYQFENSKLKIVEDVFLLKNNSKTYEFFLEANKKIKVRKDDFLRIEISNLEFNSLSSDFPAGEYNFKIKFENIEDYNNGEVSFSYLLKNDAIDYSRLIFRNYGLAKSTIDVYGPKLFFDFKLENFTSSRISLDLSKLYLESLLFGNSRFDITVGSSSGSTNLNVSASVSGKRVTFSNQIVNLEINEFLVFKFKNFAKNLTENEFEIQCFYDTPQNKLHYKGWIVFPNEVPVGTIVAFHGRKIPEGWLLCDGSYINESYPNLKSVLGSSYTPNLSDSFIYGTKDINELGKTGGEKMVYIKEENLPAHEHKFGYDILNFSTSSIAHYEKSWSSSPDKYYNAYTGHKSHWNPNTTSSNLRGLPINNLPPYYKLLYIIKAR